MVAFWFSLLFFLLALALFWGVLHWVRFKNRPDACSCGTGACLTDPRRGKENGNSPKPKNHECSPGSCRCEE